MDSHQAFAIGCLAVDSINGINDFGDGTSRKFVPEYINTNLFLWVVKRTDGCGDSLYR